MDSLTIRAYELADLSTVVSLSEQLGYPVAENAAQDFLNAISKDPNQVVLIAADELGKVVGWVHVMLGRRVFMPPVADLGGLIVDQTKRNMSIGGKLMLAAENWAKEKGCNQLIVRSNVLRVDAHRFYQRLGYELNKKQAVLRKDL